MKSRQQKRKEARDEAKRLSSLPPKFQNDLKKLDPQAKSMQINYKNQQAIYSYLLEGPIYDSTIKGRTLAVSKDIFSVKPKLEAGNFKDIDNNQWIDKNETWEFPVSMIPEASKYRITFGQKLSPTYLDELVKVQSSIDKDKTNDQIESHWLMCSIRDVKLMEQTYSKFEVDDVVFDLNIGIDRLFFTSIPDELVQLIKARNQLEVAINKPSIQRSSLIGAGIKIQKLNKQINFPELFEQLVNIFDSDSFKNFLEITSTGTKFNIDKIEGIDYRIPKIPSQVKVLATTKLSLEEPETRGYLEFNKKKFGNKCKSLI